MAFSGMALTTLGKILQAKVQAGVTLTFTKIKVGDGVLNTGSTLEALTDLISPQMAIGIQTVAALGDGTCRVRGILTNTNLASGFFVREIGVFANDPDAGEILYSVANAGTECDYLPAGGGATAIEHVLDIITAVGSTSSITAVINQSAVFATVKDLTSTNTTIAERIGYGVISGCEISAQDTPDMTVKFGTVEDNVSQMPSGKRATPAAKSALAITAADATNPRIDLTYIDTYGNLQYVAGTPAASPISPTLPSGCLPEYNIAVAAGATSITNADLTDRRKFPRVKLGTVAALTAGGDARFLAAEDINEHAHYGFLDESVINYGQALPTQAHASFNDNVKIKGTQDSNHHHSFQAYPHYNCTGTLGRMSGFWSQPDCNNGIVNNLYQFVASNPTGTGTINNLVGLKIDALTRGANNWAVVTDGTTPSQFGGIVHALRGIKFTTNGITLDGYEVGAFTPVAIGTTVAGVGTYSYQTGTYIKLGRLCHIDLLLGWTAHTGTGNLRISGLPFSATYTTVANISAMGLTFTGQLTANIPVGLNVYLYQMATGATSTEVTLHTSVSELRISAIYYAL